MFASLINDPLFKSDGSCYSLRGLRRLLCAVLNSDGKYVDDPRRNWKSNRQRMRNRKIGNAISDKSEAVSP